MSRIASSVVLILALAGAVAACHPRNQTEQAEGRHGGRGLRRVCADDIAKYCQNEDRKKRCLKQNLDKLSADCKAAVEAARGGRRNNEQNTNTGDD